MTNYLVKISLPARVLCRRYSAPLCSMATAFCPRSRVELGNGWAISDGTLADKSRAQVGICRPSSTAGCAVFMAMSLLAEAQSLRCWLGDESNLANTRPLRGGHHLRYAFVADRLVAADVQLWLRFLTGGDRQSHLEVRVVDA